MTEEQEFWEWCGLFQGKTQDACTLEWYSAWFAPLQTPTGCMEVSRKTPPIDLNNLFKYAVPKLQEGTEVTVYRYGKGWGCYLEDFHNYKTGETPAQALYKALREINKNEKD